MEKIFSVSDYGRVSAMLLDVLTEVLARQQSLERQVLSLLIPNDKTKYKTVMDGFENKVSEFKDSIYHSLAANYGDLPPDIMGLINPEWKNKP